MRTHFVVDWCLNCRSRDLPTNMKTFVVLSAVLACAYSQVFYGGYPGLGYSPFGLSPYPYSPYLRAAVPVPIAAPAPVISVPTSSQYHAQDELGQFTFGHSGDNQARVESKTFDGTVSGAYSYVDPTGKVVNVNYLADANGFRVLGANNLPEAPVAPAVPALEGPKPVEDTAEVVAAKADFQKLFAEAKAAAEAAPEEAVVSRRRRGAVLVSPWIGHALTPALVPGVAKTTLKYHQFENVEAAVPADTKKIELKEKETEVLTPTLKAVHVPVATPLAYHAIPSAIQYSVPHYYGHHQLIHL